MGNIYISNDDSKYIYLEKDGTITCNNIIMNDNILIGNNKKNLISNDKDLINKRIISIGNNSLGINHGNNSISIGNNTGEQTQNENSIIYSNADNTRYNKKNTN
jgi:hypothetical protein